MTTTARVPRGAPGIAAALAWADAAVAWLDDRADPEPVTDREWRVWQAGRAAGFEQGYAYGRHALLDEHDETDQRAWLTWLAVEHRGWDTPGRTDPRYRAWRDRRDGTQTRRRGPRTTTTPDTDHIHVAPERTGA